MPIFRSSKSSTSGSWKSRGLTMSVGGTPSSFPHANFWMPRRRSARRRCTSAQAAPARPRHLDRPGGAGDQERAQRRDCVEAQEPALYTPRMDERVLEKDLDRQIVATHRRFVKAMDARLGSMSADTKERYFAVLST